MAVTIGASGSAPRGIIARGSSRWYFPLVTVPGTLLLVANQEYLIPFEVPVPMLVTRLGLEITGAGSSTPDATVRLGIRAGSLVDSTPDALIIDAGTMVGTSTGTPGGAPDKSITISQVLPRGLYWLSATAQGATVTQPTARSFTGPHHSAMSHGTYSATLRNGFTYTVAQSGVLLPNLAVANLTVVNNAPLIAVRA